MKWLCFLILAFSFIVTGCAHPVRVRSLSEGSGKLPATEALSEAEQEAFLYATQHGDETVFQYGYGPKASFFKTSRYCYSAKDTAMKFITNDSRNVITIPLEDITACVAGTKVIKENSAGDVFLKHLSNGAEIGLQIGSEFSVDVVEEAHNLGELFFGVLMTPIGLAVGATIGTVVGGTVGLFAMGIDAATDQGTRVCREYYDEDSEVDFLMSHLCFDDE